MIICIPVWVYVHHECACHPSPKGFGSPDTRVTDTWTTWHGFWAFCKSSKQFSLQTLYPETLMHAFIISNCGTYFAHVCLCLCGCAGTVSILFYAYNHVISKICYTDSLLICMNFLSFSCSLLWLRLLVPYWTDVARVEALILEGMLWGVDFSLSATDHRVGCGLFTYCLYYVEVSLYHWCFCFPA
jgi:hypothetical protein